MSNELNDITSGGKGPVDDKRLMDYLQQQLSKQDSHELERMMADDPFVNDAVEGLEQFGNKKDLTGYVEQLNRDLQKQLDKKKKRREKRRLPDQQWAYVAIFVLLLLCIIAYVIIKRQKEKGQLPAGNATTVQAKATGRGLGPAAL
jgi:hypothetical protein